LDQIVAVALTEAGVTDVRQMAMMTSKQRELVQRFVLRDAKAEMDHAVSVRVMAGLRPSDTLRTMGLPHSVVSACAAIGITTVRDLGNTSREDLAGIRDVGKAGFRSLDQAKERADRVMAMVQPQTDDISQFVARVLDQLGLKSIRDLDKAFVAKVEDSPAFGNEAMREIEQAVANAGLTLLRINIAEAPMDMEILVDGVPQRSVAKGEQDDPILIVEDLKPFDDRKVIVVSARSKGNDRTAMRWHRSVTLNRGKTTDVAFDVAQAPVLSTRVTPTRPLETNTFYAGDTLTLATEDMSDSPNEHAFWLLFDPAAIQSGQSELPSGHRSPGTGHSEMYGIDGWLDLRGRVDAELRDYLATKGGYDWHILDNALLPTRVIGVGDTVTWTPDRELSGATLALVALGDDGYWGMTMRPVSVMDLRPGAWALPDTPIASGYWSPRQATANAGADSTAPRPRDVDRVHDALEEVVFIATAGEPAEIMTEIGNFNDAEVPMTSCRMDFGDGANRDIAVGQIDRGVVVHTWHTPGVYDLTLTTTDLLGFSRTQSLRMLVEAAPAEEVASQEPEPKNDEEQEAPEPPAAMAANTPKTPAEASFDMFRRGLEQWARDAIVSVKGDGLPIGAAIVHLHDVNNQDVLDLFDDALVRSILASGGTVYERDRERFGALQDHRVPFGTEKMYELVPSARPDSEMLTGHFQPREPIRILQGVSETPDIGNIPRVEILELVEAIDRYEDILDRAGDMEPFLSPHVFDYKLRRAEVTFEPLADTPLYTRRVRILGFVRLHDSETYEVLGSDLVETEIQDIVSAPRGVPGTESGWNTYHRNFLHQPHDELMLEEPS